MLSEGVALTSSMLSSPWPASGAGNGGLRRFPLVHEFWDLASTSENDEACASTARWSNESAPVPSPPLARCRCARCSWFSFSITAARNRFFFWRKASP